MLQGSISRTAKALNQMGYIPKQNRMGGGRAAILRHFTCASLQRILHNPTYIAKRRVKENGQEYFVNAQWEPIISEELYNAVQKKLRENDSVFKPVGFRNKYPYLLSGLLSCARCKEPLCGKSGWGKKKKKYLYYAHGSQIKRNFTTQNPGCHCTIKYIHAQPLEKAVFGRIRALLKDPKIIQGFLNQHQNGESRSELVSEIRQLENKLKTQSESIEAMLSHLEKVKTGSLAQKIYKRYEQVEEEQKNTEMRLNELQGSFQAQPEIVDSNEYMKFLDAIVERFETAPLHLQRIFCAWYMERYWSPKNRSKHTAMLGNIFWMILKKI
ncbi:MAG: recombinase family protein [Deltaproteobacteria bacterium]|nr:recombinase family protein [Deltaproteobacteria bacterium]